MNFFYQSKVTRTIYYTTLNTFHMKHKSTYSVQFPMYNILVLEMSFNYLVIATWSLNIIIVLLQLRDITNNKKFTGKSSLFKLKI